MSVFSKFDDIRTAFGALTTLGRNPFDIRFEKILSPTEAVLDGKRILLFGTNNYLGLTFDQTCVDASVKSASNLAISTFISIARRRSSWVPLLMSANTCSLLRVLIAAG